MRWGPGSGGGPARGGSALKSRRGCGWRVRPRVGRGGPRLRRRRPPVHRTRRRGGRRGGLGDAGCRAAVRAGVTAVACEHTRVCLWAGRSATARRRHRPADTNRRVGGPTDGLPPPPALSRLRTARPAGPSRARRRPPAPSSVLRARAHARAFFPIALAPTAVTPPGPPCRSTLPWRTTSSTVGPPSIAITRTRLWPPHACRWPVHVVSSAPYL